MEWFDLKGYEGLYQINKEGNIKSLDRIITEKTGKERRMKGKILNPTINNMGYLVIPLGRNNLNLLHRLIADQFVHKESAEKDCVNHIDGNKLNNEISNLEWVTKKENNKHAIDNKLNVVKKPVKCINLKNKEELFFESAREASIKTGVNYKDISACCNKKQKTAKGYIWSFI